MNDSTEFVEILLWIENVIMNGLYNAVLFGKTAKQWQDENPTLKGNMWDVATLNQLQTVNLNNLAKLEENRRKTDCNIYF